MLLAYVLLDLGEDEEAARLRGRLAEEQAHPSDVYAQSLWRARGRDCSRGVDE